MLQGKSAVFAPEDTKSDVYLLDTFYALAWNVQHLLVWHDDAMSEKLIPPLSRFSGTKSSRHVSATLLKVRSHSGTGKLSAGRKKDAGQGR